MGSKHKIVLGSLFGDEGKGNVVQWLCKNSNKPIVYRFSGGPQAGHRVVYKDKSHICSSWGSGVLLGVPTYLSENVFIDPICIYNEYKTLVDEGIEVPPLYINNDCLVITPYDVLANSADAKIQKDGTCGKGIYNTYKRCQSGNTTWAVNIAAESWDIILDEAEDYYQPKMNIELCALFEEACAFLVDHPDIFQFTEMSPLDYVKESEYDTVIWEGSQGLLLDMDCGFMPHCTPSKVGLNGIPEYILEKSPEIYLVMRPYSTRHGNGWEFTDKCNLTEYFTLDEPSNKDDGIQGIFKRGIFDFPLFCRAIDRHRLDNYQKMYDLKFNIVVTHWDCIKGDNIPINIGIITEHLMSKKAFIESLTFCRLPMSHVYLGIGEDSNIIDSKTILDYV